MGAVDLHQVVSSGLEKTGSKSRIFPPWRLVCNRPAVAIKSARYLQPLSPSVNSHGDQRRIGGHRAAIISHFKRPIPARWGAEHGGTSP
jgi:hypothetical protein